MICEQYLWRRWCFNQSGTTSIPGCGEEGCGRGEPWLVLEKTEGLGEEDKSKSGFDDELRGFEDFVLRLYKEVLSYVTHINGLTFQGLCQNLMCDFLHNQGWGGICYYEEYNCQIHQIPSEPFLIMKTFIQNIFLFFSLIPNPSSKEPWWSSSTIPSWGVPDIPPMAHC